MTIDVARVRGLLKAFDFKNLFREQLGWDNYSSQLDIPVDGTTYRLTAIAEKRGFVTYVSNAIPDRAIRLKIDRQVTKSVREHLVVYTDQPNGQQVWHWVRREAGRPLASRDHRFDASKSGDPLIQKLEALAFSLEEEGIITIVDVAGRVRAALDVDRVTKRFYDRFKAEHAAFLRFIKGIKSNPDLQWYTSLMLNRLMFVYFIQKKGFLDGDVHYLRNRLRRMQAERGRDKFQTFYRYFLLRLFHDGLGKAPADRDATLEKLLGKVPYLNGGFFEVHPLESAYPETDIPDKAFEKLFDFFDAYQWHLDERPLRADNEINPDVVGYIFEKYINQKQMGAYYTKEDITEYISKNTIIPFLFDAAEKKCAIAFKPDGAVWRLLRDDPDRYIYDAVRKGVIRTPSPSQGEGGGEGGRTPSKGEGRGEGDDIIPLPKEIAAGVKDVSKRGTWNQPAADDYALPTETWREHVARRNRCLDVREKLRKGEIHAINDLITLNLDIRQFAQDVIVNAEGPELLRAFYQAIEGVSILHPTCGSGAFLFAALNILEPLYEACLDRMQAFMEDLDRSGAKHHPEKFSDFRQVLGQIDQHPSRRYFVLKSIIINNLYGVDIMEEAVEICKLRLFLKLVAQIDRVQDIEPLPDIDFNIRAGNTLVGFTSIEEVRKSQEGKLGFAAKEIQRIEDQAEEADRAYKMFRYMQTKQGMNSKEFARAKIDLRRKLDALDAQLDRYLAGEYGIEADSSKQEPAFEKWKTSHQPFHWFVEYYGIITKGGFDAVIGNPPYVEKKNCTDYEIRAFVSESCGDLYAFTVERAIHLSCQSGRLGFIVPLSCYTVERFAPLQELCFRTCNRVYVSHWSGDAHPARLFEGVDKRLEILVAAKGTGDSSSGVYTTRYRKWYTDERPNLFFVSPQYAQLSGGTNTRFFPSSTPKVGSPLEVPIIAKLKRCRRTLGELLTAGGPHSIYYTRKFSFFLQILDFIPEVRDQGGEKRAPSELKILSFPSRDVRDWALGCLSTSLFYWFAVINSDCRNLNKRELEHFPIPWPVDRDAVTKVGSLLKALMQDYRHHSSLRTVAYVGKGDITVQYFNFRPSKPRIDQIDTLIAKEYGLTNEESEFIVNYEIKYRMGQDSEDSGDE